MVILLFRSVGLVSMAPPRKAEACKDFGVPFAVAIRIVFECSFAICSISDSGLVSTYLSFISPVLWFVKLRLKLRENQRFTACI